MNDQLHIEESLNILSLEDSLVDFELIRELLIQAGPGITITRVENESEFVSMLRTQTFDIILADFKLPGFDAFGALRWRNELSSEVPFICVSGTVGEETAIELIKQGAVDYVLKDRPRRLIFSINRALAEVNEIKAKMRAEEAFIESNLLNQSLLLTIPFGMDIVDEQGNILFLNERFQNQFGSEAIGKKCWELYRDDKRQCSDCPLLTGIELGKTEVYESFGVFGDRIFEISHTGMIFNGKKAMLEIFQDITDRKRAEKELIQAKEKAEESDRLKTAFLNNISHEIRTPMNAIIGFASFLSNPDISAEKKAYFAEVITQSSNQLLSVINDIISISTVEAGQERIWEKAMNLNTLLKQSFERFESTAQNKNLIFTFEPFLPDEKAGIQSDEIKVQQILNNLVSNAVKFTNEGFVHFGYRIKDQFIEFFVSDSGIGIPKDMFDEIFKLFRQIEISTTRLFGGSGLGLSLAKAYVELLNGKIWLESELSKGTTFYFTIPYKPALPEQPIVQPLLSTKGSASKTKKILVAEDEDNNFLLIEELLSDLNAQIIRAENGMEAVEICRNDDAIDLILMDLKMPVLDGYDASQQIRMLYPELPIIAQTAYSTDEAKEKAFACGCNEFISKPFIHEQFIELIQVQINKK